MALLPTWKLKYGLALQSTWNEAVNSGAGLPANGPKGVAPTNTPDFNPNIDFIESDKIHGNAGKIYSGAGAFTELQVGPKAAGTSFDFDVDVVTLVPLLASLTQGLTQVPDGKHEADIGAIGNETGTNWTVLTVSIDLTSSLFAGDWIYASGFEPSSHVNGLHRVREVSWDETMITGAVIINSTMSGGLTDSSKLTLIQGQYGKLIENYDRASKLDFVGKTNFDHEIPLLLSLFKNTSVTNESYCIDSSVANSVSISGARGEPLRTTIDLTGRDLDDAHNATGAFDLPTANNVPLLFQDTTCLIGDAWTTDWQFTRQDLISFDLTLSNNLEARNYNSQELSAFALGRFTVEGSIVIPWRDNTQIGWFTNETPKELILYWGTPGTAPFLMIQLHAVFKNETVGGDVEQEITLNFESTVYEVGSNHPQDVPGKHSVFRAFIADNLDYIGA